MKKLLLLLIIPLLFSCGESKKSLIGDWDVFENGVDFEGSITFYNDGSAFIEERGDKAMGVWRMAGDERLLCVGLNKEREICGQFEWFDDNSFRLENETGEYILRRK
tara:strand:+ start:645 stop:965 length:321 start_codon:yes stop_codon:yes gene_type:complete